MIYDETVLEFWFLTVATTYVCFETLGLKTNTTHYKTVDMKTQDISTQW